MTQSMREALTKAMEADEAKQSQEADDAERDTDDQDTEQTDGLDDNAGGDDPSGDSGDDGGDGGDTAGDPVDKGAGADGADPDGDGDDPAGGGGDGEDSGEPADPKLAAAPQSWTTEAKAEWAKVPESLKAEIHRRETHITRTLQESAQYKQFANNFQNVMLPHMPLIQKANLHPLQVIKDTLAQANVLHTGTVEQKAGAIATMIKDFKIDLKVLSGIVNGKTPMPAAPVQQQPQQPSPEVLEMRQYIQEQKRQQAERDAAEVNSFLEKNPIAKELRNDMADIIDFYAQRGENVTLDKAYKQALAARPDLQEKAAAAARAVAGKGKIADKRKAAAVPAGKPPGQQRIPADKGDSASLRDSLAAAFTQHSGTGD